MLCRNHHRLVDADESVYTVERLRKWKADRARIVKDALRRRRQNTNSVQLMDEIPQSVSALDLEERGKTLHSETRDHITAGFADLKTYISSLSAMNTVAP